MEKHVTVVGIVRIGLSLLCVAISVMAAVILVGVGVGVWYGGTQEVLPILAAIALSILIASAVFSVPGILGGIGILRHKQWARYLTLVVAVFDLLTPPFGTILAIYSIWVLTNRRTIQLFERR